MEQQRVSSISLINIKRAYGNSVVKNGSYYGYLQPSEWQRQLYNSFDVCFGLMWYFNRKEYIHFACRPMLVYRMTLVPLRLFHKNSASCKIFLGKWFTPSPPPLAKNGTNRPHDSIGLFDPPSNITDNSVLINKLRRNKSGQAFRCSGERFCGLWKAWYHV